MQFASSFAYVSNKKLAHQQQKKKDKKEKEKSSLPSPSNDISNNSDDDLSSSDDEVNDSDDFDDIVSNERKVGSSGSANANAGSSNNIDDKTKRGGFFSRIFGKKDSASSPPPPPPAAPSSVPNAPVLPNNNNNNNQKPQIHRRRVKADTNICNLPFNTLIQQATELFAGDAQYCEKCKVVLSETSLGNVGKDVEEIRKKKREKSAENQKKDIEKDKESDKDKEKNEKSNDEKSVSLSPLVVPRPLEGNESYWYCEFCYHINIIDLQPEEFPSSSQRDYLLEAPKVPLVAKIPSADGKDNLDVEVDKRGGDLIFVIDISGSMSSTTEVRGNVKLKGTKEVDKSLFEIPLGAGERAVHHSSPSNITYISRLQSITNAIDSQIEEMEKKWPEKRISLVFFNDTVEIFDSKGEGMGSNGEFVTGDKLYNDSLLREIGKKYSPSNSLSVTKSSLITKLYSLTETGRTALGPALRIAVSMASQREGSSVILATDGLANVGVGALDGIKVDEERMKVEEWYENIGREAKSNGITVSIISIIGSEASLSDLGKVSELTGGTVSRVDPLQLTQNISSIISKPVIATKVTATFLLHKGLKFRNTEVEDIITGMDKEKKESPIPKLIRSIGAVTEDSETVFEYEFSPSSSNDTEENETSFPFQCQIEYSNPSNGMKCLRVISATQSITTDKNVAVQNAKIALVAANANRVAARFARRGSFSMAHAMNIKAGKMMHLAVAMKNNNNNNSNSNANDDISVESEESNAQQEVILNQWMDETRQFDVAIQQQQTQLQSSLQQSQSPAPLGGMASAPSSSSSSSSFLSSNSVPSQSQQRKVKMMRNDEQYEQIQKFSSKNANAYSMPMKPMMMKGPPPPSSSSSSSSTSTSTSTSSSVPQSQNPKK